MANRLLAIPGSTPENYPPTLKRIRDWFDLPGAPVTGDPGYYDQPLAFAFMKQDPQGQETPAIPRAIREGTQYGLDLLASPYTGTVPESFVTDTALNAVGGVQTPTQPGMFLGVKAQQAPKAKMALAKRAKAAGTDPTKVWQHLGGVSAGHKSTRNNPFFEISDAEAEYRPGHALNQEVDFNLPPESSPNFAEAVKRAEDAGYGIGPEAARRYSRKLLEDEGYITTLGKILDHPELYANYPELADIPVKVGGRGKKLQIGGEGQYAGSWNPETQTINLSGDWAPRLDAGKETLLHEIQHIIQSKENWPRGSNEASMQWFYDQGMLPPGAMRDLGKLPPEQRGPEGYRRATGEWQARMTGGRRNWTAEQRAAEAPWDTSRRVGEVPDRQMINTNAQGYPGSAEQGQLAPTNSFFDLSNLEDVPNVPQEPIERYIPKKISPRLADLLGNKKVQKRVQQIVEKGVEMGGKRWYNAEPLRKAFINELGDVEGDAAFGRYMDYVAATSPRSDVGINIRNASFYYGLERKGEPMPEIGTKNPQPYGHMAQKLHQQNAQTVAGPGWDVIKNPKPPTFAANLKGNQLPVTVDAHATKLPGMLSRDPRWLATSVNVPKPGTGTKANPVKEFIAAKPRQMVAEGGLTIDDALERPFFWDAQPGPTEFAALERDFYTPIANKVGITPAQAQASAWMAGGEITGLGSPSTMGFMDIFQQRLLETAQKRGLSPQETLRRMIRGEEPLLAKSLPTGFRDWSQRGGPAVTAPPEEVIDENRMLQLMGNRS